MTIYCIINQDERYKALREKLTKATPENRQALLTEIAVMEETIKREEKEKFAQLCKEYKEKHQ